MSFPLDISQDLIEANGFCYPDWSKICPRVETAVPRSEWQPAWEKIARQWMDELARRMSSGYKVHETKNFLILSNAPDRITSDASRFNESALGLIRDHLKGAIPPIEGYGKYVVLMFSQDEEYFHYISHFYSDGEHPATGGICLEGNGYMHFAFQLTDFHSYRSVLVHELTHGCLASLPLPTWVNEAMAMRMENAICESQSFAIDAELYDRHLEYWNEETIQQFWSGESWSIVGDSFELSYSLAKVLWLKLERDIAPSKPALIEFVRTSHFQDAGNTASLELFNLDLGDLVASFLGEGDWSPKPTSENSEESKPD